MDCSSSPEEPATPVMKSILRKGSTKSVHFSSDTKPGSLTDSDQESASSGDSTTAQPPRKKPKTQAELESYRGTSKSKRRTSGSTRRASKSIRKSGKQMLDLLTPAAFFVSYEGDDYGTVVDMYPQRDNPIWKEMRRKSAKPWYTIPETFHPFYYYAQFGLAPEGRSDIIPELLAGFPWEPKNFLVPNAKVLTPFLGAKHKSTSFIVFHLDNSIFLSITFGGEKDGPKVLLEVGLQQEAELLALAEEDFRYFLPGGGKKVLAMLLATVDIYGVLRNEVGAHEDWLGPMLDTVVEQVGDHEEVSTREDFSEEVWVIARQELDGQETERTATATSMEEFQAQLVEAAAAGED